MTPPHPLVTQLRFARSELVRCHFKPIFHFPAATSKTPPRRAGSVVERKTLSNLAQYIDLTFACM
jgi:hypothetical protein